MKLALVSKGESLAPAKPFVAGLRGEHIELLATDTSVERTTDLAFTGKVVLTELLGADGLVTLDVEGTEILIRVDGNALPPEGEDRLAVLPLDHLHLFDAASGQRL